VGLGTEAWPHPLPRRRRAGHADWHLGRVEDNQLRRELAPAWVTASQRYGSLRHAGAGATWDTGTGELLIAPELGMATPVWVRHGYLADPAQRGTTGLSMRMLEKLVTNEATGSDWPDAVARATQLVPDDVPGVVPARRPRCRHG
jgi:hypothetical protein